MFPIRPQHALVPKPCSLGKTDRCDVLRRDEHLHAAETEVVQRPVRERHDGVGCDPASTRGRGQAAPELRHPVLAERQHHLAQVRVRGRVGDYEMEEAAVATAPLVERDDAGTVGRRKLGHPPRRCGIVLERECGVVVVLPERPERERRTDER